ncbi:MAG: hypothetical protein R3F11_33075 [Verrucomicrobiales bacterium]
MNPRSAAAPLLALFYSASICPADPIEFVERFDAFDGGSQFELIFDLDNNGVVETGPLIYPLSGEIDVYLRLSEASPFADLKAMRIQSVHLTTDPDIEQAAQGFTASLRDFHLRMAEQPGGTSPFAGFAERLGLSGFTWFQGNPNPLFTAAGTLRFRSGFGYEDLIDLSEL